MNIFALHNAQPEVLLCAYCTAIVVIAKTARAQYPLSIFLYPYCLRALVHLPFTTRFYEKRSLFPFVPVLIVLSARLLLLFHMCRLVAIDHLRISLPRCSIVLVVAVAASNGTKIGIVCIFEYKRPGSYFVRIPLFYANTSSTYKRSRFEAMAFCGRQPVDVVNGRGEMDF